MGTPPVIGQKVSGKVIDYFTNLPTADGMAVTTDGIDPPMMATTAADGSWTLEGVPTGSKVFLTVSHMMYRSTRNLATTVADMDVMQDAYVMAGMDVKRQYTTDGKTPTGGTAILIADLQKPDGTPLEGVPIAGVTLVDAANAPVPNIIGPFFIGTVGDIDPALTTSTAFGGRARVAILDIAPGTYTLRIVDAQQNTIDTSITTTADGATIALSKKAMGGGGNVTDPAFATDIYPRLQRAGAGGLGCGTCHTANGPGAVLIMDDGATSVLGRLQPPVVGGRIDTTTPANSLLLTKPLYEQTPPQNHPNATFLDINDPDYKLILLWITNGLKP